MKFLVLVVTVGFVTVVSGKSVGNRNDENQCKFNTIYQTQLALSSRQVEGTKVQ